MNMPEAGGLVSMMREALRGGVRLALLRRAPPERFAPSAELFALLIALELAIVFAFAFVVVGRNGELNLYELPRSLMFVPLVLLAGLVATRADDRRDLLVLPVALTSASIVVSTLVSALYALGHHRALPILAEYWQVIDYGALAWWAAIVATGVLSVVHARIPVRAAVVGASLMFLVAPSLWLPQGLLWAPRYDEAARGRSFYSLAEERAFYAQHGALERELAALAPQRRGIPDVYVIAAGLYAGEDVFMKEVRMITDLLERRFDAAGRTVRLINNARTLEERPVASLTSLTRSLERVGELMDPDEDLLVLYLSSHGSEKHELMVDFRPMSFKPIDPPALKAALDASGIRWKVVIVSACYSGGFIEALRDETTLVISASSADRQSFGCGSDSDATYLARALFDEALRSTFSFEEAFRRAEATIAERERRQGYTPSQPQIHVGSAIRGKLTEVEARLAALGAGR
jgi:hypothetical protein